MPALQQFLARALAKLFIFAFVVVATGAIGYLYQAQFFHAISRSRHKVRHMETMTQAEFQTRTRRGWYWGCACGAVLGTLLVILLANEKD